MNSCVLARQSPAQSRLAERLVRRRLTALEHGALTVDGETYGHATDRCGLAATVRVHDARFWAEVAFGGSVGAGEAYMLGYWDADDLTAAMRILLQNGEVLDSLETGLARLAAPLRKLAHWAARNTRRGSRRNIAAHYDLGNEFFALFLDPTLMYSSAVFERPDMTLEEASRAKLERICRRLDLAPGDRVLEIGTGWGGFALHAAGRYGCHVTTTTISEAQYRLARERVAAAELDDLIEVRREDYRDLAGRYDKLVSIEMVEAVGHEYLDAYFAKCSALLEDHGMMLLQAITIQDQRYDAARRSVDFIRRHIFPGSCIPSVASICGALARASDLKLFHLDDIGPHYAITLARWRDNLARNAAAARALGLTEAFLRKWEFYFRYCEAGFAERTLGDVQALLVKPGARP
jgi:cyclopropane-fatty-acyl-phospholipid synthase